MREPDAEGFGKEQLPSLHMVYASMTPVRPWNWYYSQILDNARLWGEEIEDRAARVSPRSASFGAIVQGDGGVNPVTEAYGNKATPTAAAIAAQQQAGRRIAGDPGMRDYLNLPTGGPPPPAPGQKREIHNMANGRHVTVRAGNTLCLTFAPTAGCASPLIGKGGEAVRHSRINLDNALKAVMGRRLAQGRLRSRSPSAR